MRKPLAQTFYMRRVDHAALVFSVAAGLIMLTAFVSLLTLFPNRGGPYAAAPEPQQVTAILHQPELGGAVFQATE